MSMVLETSCFRGVQSPEQTAKEQLQQLSLNVCLVHLVLLKEELYGDLHIYIGDIIEDLHSVMWFHSICESCMHIQFGAALEG